MRWKNGVGGGNDFPDRFAVLCACDAVVCVRRLLMTTDRIGGSGSGGSSEEL